MDFIEDNFVRMADAIESCHKRQQRYYANSNLVVPILRSTILDRNQGGFQV